ncbi:hypothetical protein TNCV_4120551 [Trichonephila clavipes]|nr:hypothetical protein TNCV_4120551 [Trichonephila clavipes]
MITNFFIPELNNHDVQELWFQQDGAKCPTARATIDLLKDTFGDRLISRFGPVNWPPRSCDLTPLDYFFISGKEIARRIAFKITPSCCLSEKWRIIKSVRRNLDSFTRGRIIGKLEEGRSVTSVAADFGIAHSIVSRLWRQFQTTGTAIRGFSSGRP